MYKRQDEKVAALHIELTPEKRLQLIVEENVRLQLEHLQDYPFIRKALAEKKVNLHGWVYDIATGEIKILSTQQGRN